MNEKINEFSFMNEETNYLTIGENGMSAYISTNEVLLDLFAKLVRNLPQEKLILDVRRVLTIIRENNDENLLVYLFVLMFQTRDCRGGKGEKKLFYDMFLEIYKEYPKTIISLFKLVPMYGYYKDFENLFEIIETFIQNKKEEIQENNDINFLELQNSIIDFFSEQLLKDKHEIDTCNGIEGKLPSLSFVSKFAPREGKKFGTMHKKLVRKMFPKSRTPEKEYRKLIVKISKVLEIPENFMCANEWDKIDFKKVPSLCLNRFRKAFLNEKVNKESILSLDEEETGNRFPNDVKRVQCRKNLKLATALNNVCGKVLLPNELVGQLMKNYNISDVESSVYDAQWIKIEEGVLEGIQKVQSNSSAIDLGNLVALVDVSGSMQGIPMEAAIALGILVAKFSNKFFKDKIITFETNPQWVSIEGLTSLKDKVNIIKNAEWGGSTNFEAALELILQIAIDEKLNPEDIPNLIVFSDMQFNQAGKYNETMHELIKRRFSETGLHICGREYSSPKIIYWNLRGNTNGFIVQGDTPNTILLSGNSPSLFKAILSGEPLTMEEVQEDGTILSRQITPAETFKKIMDDTRYNPVREILSLSNEGVLSRYINHEEN